MQWSHLPVAGGIYDQHPKLLDEWMILFQATQEHQQQEMDRQRAESKRRKR